MTLEELKNEKIADEAAQVEQGAPDLSTIISDGDTTSQFNQAAAEKILNAAAGMATGEQAAPAEMSPEEFQKIFFGAFDMAADIWKIDGLKIDQSQKLELAGATVSARKLYNMALKYPALHFLIDPAGGWLGDWALISVFVYQKSNAVSRHFGGKNIIMRAKSVFGGIIGRFFKKTSGESKKGGFWPFKKSEIVENEKTKTE